MAARKGATDQRADEDEEQPQLDAFLAHTLRTPALRARLRQVDPYEVVEIDAADGSEFEVFIHHRVVCPRFALPKPRQ